MPRAWPASRHPVLNAGAAATSQDRATMAGMAGMAGTRGWAEYWRDDTRGLEAMHARFRDHVFAPHSHDAYSFGVTDAGAQQFHCRGALHTSAAGMVMALNPDDPHD